MVLNDGMSSVLKKITSALDTTLKSFEQVQRASGKAVDVSAIQKARSELASANAEIDDMAAGYRKAKEQEDQLNDSINSGTNAADKLLGKITSLVAAYASLSSIKNAVTDSLSAADTQIAAQTQLASVMNNMGTLDYYDKVLDKASEIQSKGIYGDEAMIAGAAELSTYFSDAQAVLSMMDTLSNYAMGMSGGGELDTTAMVDYATGIGKIMSGSYDAMTKKGFEFTDVQKAIIEGTATNAQIVSELGEEYVGLSNDMQAAAVIGNIIDESWAGLYETMSNTPEGKIISLKNTLGDMKETVGAELYPAVLELVDMVQDNLPEIETIIDGIVQALQVVITVLSWVVDLAISAASTIIENWSWIGPIVLGVAAAWAVYQIWQLAAAAAAGIMAAKQAIVNAVMTANPILIVVMALIAFVAIVYAAVGALNTFAGTSVSATGIVMGAFATLAAIIYNCFALAWNIVAAFIEFFVNVWNYPEYTIKAFAVNVAVAFLSFCLACVTGTQSAVSVIVGLWNAFGQAIYNVLAFICNIFFAIVEAIVNGWNSGVYQIKTYLVSMATSALSVAQSMASSFGSAASNIANVFISAANTAINAINAIIGALNNIPGVNISTVSTIGSVSWDGGAASIADTASSLQGLLGDAPETWTAPTLELGSLSDAYNEGKEIGADLVSGMESTLTSTISSLQDSIADTPEGYWSAPTLDYINLSDAAQAGYEFGQSVDDKISDLFDYEGLDLSSSPYNLGSTLDDIADDTGSIADDGSKGSGTSSDALDVSEEQLEYLRDIAERDAINRFTTAEVKIDMTGMTNKIDSSLDIDGIISQLTSGFSEALVTAAEGVHA
jgi:phage-related protein